MLGGSDVVRLTPTEWRLLEILLRHPGQLVASRQLLTGVGPEFREQYPLPALSHGQAAQETRGGPGEARHLLTEPGMGYRYQPPDHTE